VWTRLIWLWVSTKGGLLSTRNEPSSSIKLGEFIGPVEELLASQEGLYRLYLLSWSVSGQTLLVYIM
jgi:hypothetical protein